MAAITLADVTDVAADVTAISTIVLAWVNAAAINPELFDGEAGPTTKLVRCLIAAHFASIGGLGGSGGAAGPLASISEGGMSRSYAVSASNAGSYLTGSNYGTQAAWLIRIWCGGAYLAE